MGIIELYALLVKYNHKTLITCNAHDSRYINSKMIHIKHSTTNDIKIIMWDP